MDDELDQVRRLARPLTSEADLDPLVDVLATKRHVLLGEASHGTSEYYRWRGAITRRLIEEHGFDLVAVEGDWPDCFAVNRWVKGRTDHATAADVLRRYDRWPTWMWANEEVAEFLEWLRGRNAAASTQVGFYGLDVYSLWESLRAVLDHVRDHDPDALAAAEDAAACFEPYREDPQGYAWATRLVPTTCEDEVVRLLVELRERRTDLDAGEPEAELDAEQNAEVVAGAERYYRAMMTPGEESWNVRDCHMADTLDRLLRHHGPGARAVVWEHNTHVGDARATDMAQAGMVNVGQLARERFGEDDVALVGFGGAAGSVIAAERWGADLRRFPVPPAPDDSHEGVIGRVRQEPTLFVFPTDRTGPWLGRSRGHRAIGVVYDPARDPYGNWVPTVLGRRYDAFVWFPTTDALHPLHAEPLAYGQELETAPWGT